MLKWPSIKRIKEEIFDISLGDIISLVFFFEQISWTFSVFQQQKEKRFTSRKIQQQMQQQIQQLYAKLFKS